MNRLLGIVDNIRNEEENAEVTWESEELKKFFTSEGQIKTPRLAKPKKERKDIEQLSHASPDGFREIRKDSGVLWHITKKGRSLGSLVSSELDQFEHPRFLRKYLNYRVFFFFFFLILIDFF